MQDSRTLYYVAHGRSICPPHLRALDISVRTLDYLAPRGLVARSYPPSPLDRVEEILAFQPACGTSRGSIPSASILPARDCDALPSSL